MSSKVVADAIDAYLAANWTACPILVDGEDDEAPADGSAFLVVQYYGAQNRRATMQPVFIEEGAFRIVVNTPRGVGPALIRSYADQLVSLFRGVDVGPVHCLTPSEPFAMVDGNYLTGAIVVPFRHVADAR
jgi:hypothetical protein